MAMVLKKLKDKGRKPTVWEMHTGGETRMNLDKIRRIMEKHGLRLSNPRGALKTDVLKKLEELSPKQKENEEVDPRWNKLKELLKDK